MDSALLILMLFLAFAAGVLGGFLTLALFCCSSERHVIHRRPATKAPEKVQPDHRVRPLGTAKPTAFEKDRELWNSWQDLLDEEKD